jgi:hypothetical protein
MKKLLSAALVILSINAFAQKNIIVDEAPRAMSKDTQFSYSVEIPQAKVKQVEKDWLKYTSAKSKGKATVLNGEHLQTEAFNKNISANPFNVYSKLFETIDGVNLTVWITDINAAFISKTPNSIEDLAVQKYVRDFAVSQYQQAVREELNTEKDKLKKLEKELVGLIKDEESAVKKTNDNERNIARAKDAITTNDADIDASSNKISNQKDMVNQTAADRNANKGAQKTLSEIESDKKSLQRKNDSKSKSIDNKEKDNRAQERNLAGAQEKQTTKKAEIDLQKVKVAEVQTKLAGIK